LTHLLCERVVEVFNLASAAFFLKGENREFRRANPAAGWADHATTVFEPTDAVVRDLESASRLRPIRLSLPAANRDTVSGIHANMTLPVWLRGQLAAFVIYGAFRQGDKWEADDAEALSGLALACTAALYRIEADRVT
jgi:GAF domain-containing protein